MDYPMLFSVLGDVNRLRIINLLYQTPLCVCELETLLNMTQSNVSRHLTRLRTAKIVASIKDGQWVHYALDEAFIASEEKLYVYLSDVLAQMEICVEDKIRFKRYSELALSCKDIRNDAEAVQIKIGGENHDQ